MTRQTLVALGVAVVVALAGAPAALAGAEGGTPAPTSTPTSTPTVTEPNLPEPVADYIASGLIPRLTDLYRPGAKGGTGVVFDDSAAAGGVHRVFSWSPASSGGSADRPLRLTNRWLVPVTVHKKVVGLATVWINPGTDAPELADFALGPDLAAALAAAPPGYVLVDDATRSAWFASDGVQLVPLVSGGSGVDAATSVAAYEKRTAHDVPAPAAAPSGNQGLLIAGAVLAVVVVGLALFVLLPDRRRRPAPVLPTRGYRAAVRQPRAGSNGRVADD